MVSPAEPPGADRRGAAKVTGLAEFAGQVLGDPHALDRDSAAGRALARLAAVAVALSDMDDMDVAADAADGQHLDRLELAVDAAANVLQTARWRSVWSQLGITCDQVSSTVLLLNVPLRGASPALGQVSSTRGEPVWVTGRMTDGQRLLPRRPRARR